MKIMRILVIEDDKSAAAYLLKGLQEAGHVVDVVHDGNHGCDIALEDMYDILIIDRMLPGKDGITIIHEIRAENITTPVLILSALGEVDDKVKGLRAGGDDYLTKPYSFSELLARIDVLSRRSMRDDIKTKYIVDDLEIDLLARTVHRNGSKIILQPREFKLLEYLVKNEGKVVTRTMLLENVWNYHFDPQTNVIDVHISRLRSKIDKDFKKAILHTVRGAGYIIKAQDKTQ